MERQESSTGREQRPGLAAEVDERPRRRVAEPRGRLGGEHRRPVRREDDVPERVDLPGLLDEVALGAALEARPQPRVLERGAREVEAGPDELELVREELVRLHEDVLAHADLAEVVQERGVAELLEGGGIEADAPEVGGRRLLDRAGEAAGEERHPAGVAGGGRVPLLDRDHRRLHEPLEEPLDLRVQERVLDRGRRRPRERSEQLLVLGGEGAVPPVQRLEHADDLALRVPHRHGEDVPRDVAAAAVHALVEARIRVRVVDPDRLPGRGDRARDPRAERDPDLLRAVRDLAPELALLAIGDEDRAAIGLGHLRRLVDDEPEQPLELTLRGQRLRDVEDRLELLEPALQGGVRHVDGR